MGIARCLRYELGLVEKLLAKKKEKQDIINKHTLCKRVWGGGGDVFWKDIIRAKNTRVLTHRIETGAMRDGVKHFAFMSSSFISGP